MPLEFLLYMYLNAIGIFIIYVSKHHTCEKFDKKCVDFTVNLLSANINSSKRSSGLKGNNVLNLMISEKYINRKNHFRLSFHEI